MDSSRGEVTELLRRWCGGDAQALEQLMPIVYDELRRLARYHLRGKRDGHTLPGTALVHEVYLRLCNQEAPPQLASRAHFFAVAAQMMRRILVDHARRKGAAKRGGLAGRALLEEALTVPVQDCVDLLALDESLKQLAAVDPRKSRVVEMRFFGGLSANEIAAVLGSTEATVRRDWTIARAWLYRRLEGAGAE
jgi:RNA polymerase sigma factor (TIGR02999 family)